MKYQEISPNDWWDNPLAPWNKQDSYVKCEDCNGDGGVWYDHDGNVCSVSDYERKGESDKLGWLFDECLTCLGTGEIKQEE